MKILKVIYIIGLCLPILNIISIFILFNGASDKLGRMPRYGDKHAYELGLIEQYDFAVSALGLILMPLILLVTSGLYFIYTRRNPFNTNKIFLIISLIMLFIALGSYDMNGMDWFWD